MWNNSCGSVLTMGSRGDVQPFVALGVGLRQAGYQVRLATHANFESMIREQGLDFAVIEGNPQEFVQSETAQAMMRTRNPIEFNRRFREALDPVLTSAQLDSWNACQGTDAIMAGSIAFWGIDIAERLQVPSCFSLLQPASPTRAFPTSTVPPAELLEFLAAGSPPVYIGFGSMGGKEAEQATEIALAALNQTGQRGLLLTGWSGVDQGNLPDSIFKVSAIPHGWLFPRMVCVMHHGGAGTTAATFRSGVPGVIVPFLADQPFWSYRAFKLGVSPAPINRKTMTVNQLATAISAAVHDVAMRDRAAALGEKIRSENGVARAVEIIEQTIKQGVS